MHFKNIGYPSRTLRLLAALSLVGLVAAVGATVVSSAQEPDDAPTAAFRRVCSACHGHAQFCRQRGPDFDELGGIGKSGPADADAVRTERQAPDDHQAGRVSIELLLDLVRQADDFDGPGQRRSGRIRHSDAELPSVGLAELTEHDEGEQASEHGTYCTGAVNSGARAS